jgi:hypothetical protein
MMVTEAKYRAQVRSNDGQRWVDGGLFGLRQRAEADAERLAEQYGNEAVVAVADLTEGEDCRGDRAVFIEERHFGRDGWTLDAEAAVAVGCGPTFFRVIEDGIEQRGHGWAEASRVVQWG